MNIHRDHPVTNTAPCTVSAAPAQAADLHRCRRTMAVAVGLEPTVELPPHTLSRSAPPDSSRVASIQTRSTAIHKAAQEPP